MLQGANTSIVPKLAEFWTHCGAAEHASIASFSRHALQMLAVGAPPFLLEQVNQAAMDEITHARICYSLASVYHGHAVHPGPLDVDGDFVGRTDRTARSPRDRHLTVEEAVVAAVVRDGCIGETLAAMDAQASAQRAVDPLVQHAFATIARDETR